LPADKPSGAKDNLKVALVRQSGIGDYFEQWGSGAKAQLDAAGATVDVYDARNDNAKQATDFNTAWGVTMPAHLDTVPQPAMFEEAISGLVTREVDEPELFKHFFG
jgi:hypothetical protein